MKKPVLALAPLTLGLVLACGNVVEVAPPTPIDDSPDEQTGSPDSEPISEEEQRERLWLEYCACWIPAQWPFCLAREDDFGCYAESITMERLAAHVECRCAPGFAGTQNGNETPCIEDVLEHLEEPPEYFAFNQACHSSGCDAKLACDSGLHRGFTPDGYAGKSACFELAGASCHDLNVCVSAMQLGCVTPPP